MKEAKNKNEEIERLMEEIKKYKKKDYELLRTLHEQYKIQM